MTTNSFFFNGCFDKKRIKSLISWSLYHCGEHLTVDLLENLKNIGFVYATKAGVSLGLDDLKIPPAKSELIFHSDKEIEIAQINYKQGYVTGIEKFQQLIDTWHKTSEILKQNVIHHFKITDILNPVYMMAFSGARGNISQVRQLVGMRGLMSDPQGQILDFPIKSNFREGLTLTEYIISCYGARKGVVDTALKTANSGYLTRRLVDVSHHIIVSDFDCKTEKGIVLNTISENQKNSISLQSRLVGRILAQDVFSTTSIINTILVPKKKSNGFSNTSNTSNTTTILVPKKKSLVANSNASNKSISEKLKWLNYFHANEHKLFFNDISFCYSYIKQQYRFLFAFKKTSSKKIQNNARLFALVVELCFPYFFDESQDWIFKKRKYSSFHIDFLTSDQKIIQYYQRLKLVYARLQLNKNFPFYQLVVFLTDVSFFYPKKQLIARKNQEISLSLSEKIASLKKQVLVRSPLTCEIKNSVCQLCYGWSLAHRKLVSLGEAVGIIAAQSIGEPGTQLTMRTFHTGGVFSGDIMSEIKAPFNGVIQFSKSLQGMLIRTPHGKIAFLTKVAGKFTLYPKQNTKSRVSKQNSNDKNLQKISFHFPAFTILFTRNNEHVSKTQIIAEFSSTSASREQRIQAYYNVNAEIAGEVYFKKPHAKTKKRKNKIMRQTISQLGSIWILSGKIFTQPIFTTVFPQVGDIIDQTSLFGQYHTMSKYNGFITMTVKKPIIDHPFSKTKIEKNWTYEDYNAKKPKLLPKTRIFLNYSLISILIHSIEYKKIGYFFLRNTKKKIECNLNNFFYPTSLQASLQDESEQSIKLRKNFCLYSYPKQYQTQTGGIVVYDNFYANEKFQCGEIFWISEETHRLNLQQTLFFATQYNTYKTLGWKQQKVSIKTQYRKNWKTWIHQTNPLFFYCNPQGKIGNANFILYGYVNINKTNYTYFKPSSKFSTQSSRKKNTVLGKSNTNYLNTKKPLVSIYKSDVLGFKINPLSFIFSLRKLKFTFPKKHGNKYMSDFSYSKFRSYVFQCVKNNKKINTLVIKNNHVSFLQPQFPWFPSTKSGYFLPLFSSLFLIQTKFFTYFFKNTHDFSKRRQIQKKKSKFSYKKKITSNFNLFTNKVIPKKQNKTVMKVNRKSGWVYFPINRKQCIHQHKTIIKPGFSTCDTILFDQYPVYIECISLPKFASQNKKNTIEKNIHLKNSLYVENVYKEFYKKENKKNKNFSNTLEKNQSLKNNTWKTFFPTLDILFVHSANFFFKKKFAVLSILRNKKKKYKTFFTTYKKIMVENYVKNTIFQNKVFVQKKNMYNYKKIYFIKNILKTKNHKQSQIHRKIKNSLFFQFKNFDKKNNLFILSIPNRSLWKPSFLILIRKIKFYTFIHPSHYKKVLVTQNRSVFDPFMSFSKMDHKKTTFSRLKTFNKQHRIRNSTMKAWAAFNPDFVIKPFFTYAKNKKTSFHKKIFIFPFCILFQTPKNDLITNIKIQLFFKPNFHLLNSDFIQKIQKFFSTQINTKQNNLAFLIKEQNTMHYQLKMKFTVSFFQELESKNFPFFVSKKKTSKTTQNTILISSQNSASNPVVKLTKFFSPYQGEIVKIKTEKDSKEKPAYLVLTDEDQTTFSIASLFSGKMSSLKIFLGKSVDYGTKIHDNIVIPKSGKIIQIEKSKITLRHAQSILSSSNKIIFVKNKDFIEKNALVMQLFYQRLKTGDIVQGIPKIEQLFEGRKNRQGDGLDDSIHRKLNFLFRKYIKEYDFSEAATRTLNQIQQLIVYRVQQVYQSQGVTIAEKHLEIIVRQMTSKVRILDGGSTNLLVGELVDLDWIEAVNKNIDDEQNQQDKNIYDDQNHQNKNNYDDKNDPFSTFYDDEDYPDKDLYDNENYQNRNIGDKQNQLNKNILLSFKTHDIDGEKILFFDTTFFEKSTLKQQNFSSDLLDSPSNLLDLPSHLLDSSYEFLDLDQEFKKRKIKYIPVILGITKKSLDTKSFISEASFQETTRILTKSAIARKTDFLKGLKENVILGYVIPAGTGFNTQLPMKIIDPTQPKFSTTPMKIIDSTQPKYSTTPNSKFKYETYTVLTKILSKKSSKNNNIKSS